MKRLRRTSGETRERGFFARQCHRGGYLPLGYGHLNQDMAPSDEAVSIHVKSALTLESRAVCYHEIVAEKNQELLQCPSSSLWLEGQAPVTSPHIFVFQSGVANVSVASINWASCSLSEET